MYGVARERRAYLLLSHRVVVYYMVSQPDQTSRRGGGVREGKKVVTKFRLCILVLHNQTLHTNEKENCIGLRSVQLSIAVKLSCQRTSPLHQTP